MKEMKRNPSEFEYGLLEKYYGQLEPYQYFRLYLMAHKVYVDRQSEVDMFMQASRDPESFTSIRNMTLIAAQGFNKAKITEIDEDLMPLIEDTRPSYEEIRCPYPAMFINKQFHYGNLTFNGFMVIDLDYFPEIQRGERPENLRVISVILNRKQKFEFYSIEPLAADLPAKWHDYLDDEERKEMIKGAKTINKFAANLLNIIVNDEKEIIFTDIKISEEQNIKRARRGKKPLPDKLYIRLGGDLKVYAQCYREHRTEARVRHLVRGFWRHYRSDWYKDHVKGSKIWIKPFYRGMNLPERIVKFIHLGRGKHETGN